MMTPSWTAEQILALAPDPQSAKAGQQQATLSKWISLEWNQHALWGLCKGSGSKPYQTQIDLDELAFRCSCPSRKFPCKHALGLFLLFATQPATFQEARQPAWVTDWLEARRQKAQKSPGRSKIELPKKSDSSTQAKRVAQRESKIESGIIDLRLWLEDLVRQGFAHLQTQDIRFWDTPAARLVDAQAPGLARMVRDLSLIPNAGEGWQGILLEELSSLYLLLTAYEKIDQLPPELQSDLRSLVGWTENQAALLDQPGISDIWMVAGQRVSEESIGKLGQSRLMRTQYTWLCGKNSRKYALLLHFAPPGQPLDTRIVPGTSLEAEIVFYPGAYPLRALLKNTLTAPEAIIKLPGYPTMAAATSVYAAAVSVNPWLRTFPMTLNEVIPFLNDGKWFLVDNDERLLPLSRRFQAGWTLLALSGGYPVTCFGEWDGRAFFPLSCVAGAQWAALV